MESCKHPNDFIALSNFLIISLSWGLRENISFPGLFAWIALEQGKNSSRAK